MRNRHEGGEKRKETGRRVRRREGGRGGKGENEVLRGKEQKKTQQKQVEKVGKGRPKAREEKSKVVSLERRGGEKFKPLQGGESKTEGRKNRIKIRGTR